MRKLGIIFDLDGTLWNTAETIVPVLNEVLNQHKETDKQISVSEMYGYMGKTLEQISELMLPELEKEIAMSILNECCMEEQKFLRKLGGKLYDKLEETLSELKSKYDLYIVSNCQDGYIQSFLDFHSFGQMFKDFEMSGRTGKTKGENIQLVINRNHIDKAVYVGDTQGDFDAAKSAGIPFVFAEYGFGSVDNCIYSINEISSLPNLLKRII